MLNPNKISEIKIIIDQLHKDIDSLSETEHTSPLRWEELFITISLIKEKVATLKTEQERYYLKQLVSELKETLSEITHKDTITPAEAGNITEQIAEHAAEYVAEQITEQIVSEQYEPVVSVEPIVPLVVVPEKPVAPEPVILKSEDGKEKYVMAVDESVADDADDVEIEFDFTEDFIPVNDAAKPHAPEWMRDIPGPQVDDLHKAVTLNDKLYFIRELFKGDEDQYRLSLQRLNEMESMKEALEYTRNAFTHWDEESNAVYRFYMLLRRRYNG